MSGFLVSGLVFAAFCAVIAARVLSSFRQQGRGAEIWVALGFLASGISVVAAVALQSGELASPANHVAAASGAAFSCAAAGCVLRFVSLVFRIPPDPAARVAQVGIVASLAVAAVLGGRAFQLAPERLAELSGLNLAPNLWLGAALAWLAFEALRYWDQLRRRASLGLSSPLMVNRMLLYGIGSALSAAILFSAPLAAAIGVDPFTHPVFQATNAVLGTPIGIVYYLALVPPARYRAWIEREAPAPS